MCSIDIYLEGLIFGVYKKWRKHRLLHAEGEALFLEFYSIYSILRFSLEAIYFHNNEYCCILLNNFFCLQLQKELNNGRDDLISGPYIFGQKGIVSVNKWKSIRFQSLGTRRLHQKKKIFKKKWLSSEYF